MDNPTTVDELTARARQHPGCVTDRSRAEARAAGNIRRLLQGIQDRERDELVRLRTENAVLREQQERQQDEHERAMRRLESTIEAREQAAYLRGKREGFAAHDGRTLKGLLG